MEKNKFLILAIIILFILNLFTLGYVIMGRGEHHPPKEETDMHGPRDMDPNRKHPGRPDEVIINRLKLNKDQVLKFEELKTEHRKQVEEIQFASKKLHDEYFGLLKSDSTDAVKEAKLLTDIANNQKQLDNVTFVHFFRIKQLCDKEQKVLFNTFIEEIAASFKPPMPRK